VTVASGQASPAFTALCAWPNLLAAWRSASAGKRGQPAPARFEHRLADTLLALQAALRAGTYRPGGYVNFLVHEPKRRLISAAPFRDRVVHHALCRIIEPRFEALFSAESYANRAGKGTHAAVDRLQRHCRRYRYVLRLDIVQHFPSIDHAILLAELGHRVPEPDVMALVETILASGADVLSQEYRMAWFPGDVLADGWRPRGLPIGNLTSQFWSNCYLNPLDQFIRRELRCPAYLRYVDDMALFSDSKRRLWDWKAAIVERLARLRLRIHDGPAQVARCSNGIPWLGFVVYPDRRRLKGRNVRNARRRLHARLAEYHRGAISFAELDAAVRGWLAHAGHGDTWRLRERLLDELVIVPQVHRRNRRP